MKDNRTGSINKVEQYISGAERVTSHGEGAVRGGILRVEREGKWGRREQTATPPSDSPTHSLAPQLDPSPPTHPDTHTYTHRY